MDCELIGKGRVASVSRAADRALKQFRQHSLDAVVEEARIESFPPIENPGARLLILGTMPSVVSLQQAFYYAHPRNCFWPMMAEILGETRPQTDEDKRHMLSAHGIALWDVAKSCVRPGSLDSHIKDALPNDIHGLLARCPKIELILLNGGTAMALYRKMLPTLAISHPCRQMPSTSPAYTLPYEQKRSAWAEALGPLLTKKEGYPDAEHVV